MGIIIRQGIISTIFSYAGVVLGYLNVLYFFPAVLSADQLGLYRTIQSAAMVLVPIGQFGLKNTVMRYFPAFQEEAEVLTQFFTFSLLSLLGACLLLTGIYLLIEQPFLGYFAENASEVQGYSLLILLTAIAMIILTVLEAFSRSTLNITLPAFLRDVAIKLGTTLAIVCYGQGWVSLNALLASITFFHGLASLVLVGHLLRKGVFAITTKVRGFFKSHAATLWNYGMFALLTNGAVLLVGNIDTLMVSGLLGLDQTAIYSTAVLMAMVIDMPKKALTQVNVPVLSRAFQKNNFEEVTFLYRATGNSQLVAGLLLFIGVAANLDNVYALMPEGDYYAQGFMVFIIAGATRVVDMGFSANGAIIQLSPYFRFNMVSAVVLGTMTVTTNLLLIPQYGMIGAAIATFASILSYNLLNGGLIYWKYRLSPFSGATLKGIAIGIIAATAGFLLPYLGSTILDILVRSALITAVFIPLMYWLKVSPEINRVIDLVLQKVGIKR